jgi:hypothetical protein
MQKIITLFKRDKQNPKIVTPEYALDSAQLQMISRGGFATEKVDGMNVRVTVRNEMCVRLEKRRNPNKNQKEHGIIEPWYAETSIEEPGDEYLCDALNNTSFNGIKDGEWSAEAYGPKIQGNPLKVGERKLMFFHVKYPQHSCGLRVVDGATVIYEDLKRGLKTYLSRINPEVILEGLVYYYMTGIDHCPFAPIAKIKVRDFEDKK